LVADIYLKTSNQQQAQQQLEIIRQLILLAGGQSSVDKNKGMARLMYDVDEIIRKNP